MIAQFYATLFVHENSDYFLFTIGGKQFTLGLAEFAEMLGFDLINQAHKDLHRRGVVEDSHVSFMYDMAYEPMCVHGQTKSLIPYYRLLN